MQKIELVVEGASDAERARGVAVAEAVLRDALVSYSEAGAALIAREVWDLSGFPDELMPRGDVARASSAWDRAERAALAACCAGRPAIPEGARLILND